MVRRKEPGEALKLVSNMFDYQSADGQLPEHVGEIGVSYRISAPMIQGFALNYILNGEFSGLTKKDSEELYHKLADFADWWFTHRDHEGNRIPKIYHPDESGCCTEALRTGAPVISCEMLALLIMTSEVCGHLAERAGIANESEKRLTESKRLLSVLVNELWNGKQFICRDAESLETIQTDRVLVYLPIILGSRLPQSIIDEIAAQLDESNGYLTNGGIVSVKKESGADAAINNETANGIISAPVQVMLSIGLRDAGQANLARKLASRYCNFVSDRGFSDKLYESELKRATNALWDTCSAACFLILLDGLVD